LTRRRSSARAFASAGKCALSCVEAISISTRRLAPRVRGVRALPFAEKNLQSRVLLGRRPCPYLGAVNGVVANERAIWEEEVACCCSYCWRCLR
jgi:hypothetical protein